MATADAIAMPRTRTPWLLKALGILSCLVLWLSVTLAGPTWVEPTHTLGLNQPFQSYVDPTHTLTLPAFLALDPSTLTSHQSPLTAGFNDATWWLTFQVPAAWFGHGDLWLEIAPSYLDQLTLWWRPAGTTHPWQIRQAGDRDGAANRAGDLNYRTPVFVISPPPPDTTGYEFVLRLRSTSTLLLEPRLWHPPKFASYAARDSAFWSFYFGASTISTALALLLALGLRTRLLWSVLPFSATYLLVACVQGFVGWSQSDGWVALQHYLTGILTLLGYPAMLWMCIEALDLRQHHPRLYRATLVGIAAGLLLTLAIPLNLYGHAVQLLVLLAFLTAPVILVVSLTLWWQDRLAPLNVVFGLVPMFYVISSLLALLTTTALIPYYRPVYQLWQYMVMLVMMLTTLLVMLVGVQRIRRERELARELERERAARFQQRQFMGMISHEFRTPLAVITGALENLKRQAADQAPDPQRLLRLERATQRLVQLTDNCLADARLAAGDLHLDRQTVDALTLVRQVAEFADLAASHRLEWHDDSSPCADAACRVIRQADPALLRIALSNLLDNAVKHTPHDSKIALRLTTRPGWVIIQVSDEGPGIDPADEAVIFERFRQSGDSTPRPPSWGLGLWVARQIARAHGGDLKLAVNTPNGCRFDFWLPTTAC